MGDQCLSSMVRVVCLKCASSVCFRFCCKMVCAGSSTVYGLELEIKF